MIESTSSRRDFLRGSAAVVVLASASSGLLRQGAAYAHAPEPGRGTRTFAHPGILHTTNDIARLRAAVAAQTSPIYDGYLAFAAHARSSSSYTVQNTGQIVSWGRGPNNSQGETAADAGAAYQNALMWAVTGNRAHADKARDILNVWSASLGAITGADGPLGAGLQGFRFANAAELLRHTGYDGWSAIDIARCEQSFLRVWYPAISPYMLYANGNWDLTAIQCILAIAVFCDQVTLFEDALRYAAAGTGNGSVAHRIVAGTGQGQESGRDQGHEQLATGLLGYAAQVAWNQGVDLWGFDGNRILSNYEYNARFNLGEDVPFTTDLDRTGKYIKKIVSINGRGSFPPVYEVALAHYAGVRGVDAPYTKAVVFRGAGGARVMEGSNDDFTGFGTFAFAEATPLPRTMPTPPAGLTAVGEQDTVVLSWLPSTSADFYTLLRAGRADGPYEPIASRLTAPGYTDRAIHTGRVYYYAVRATNELGSSAGPAWAAAAAGLPKPWMTQDVGQVKTAGSTHFDGERFVLEASGTADTYRLAAMPLRGDGTITARIVWPLSSQYSKIGVTLRASLDTDAAHASMLIQGLPLHTWSGVWTVRPRAGAGVSATGSTPVPPTQQQGITTAAGFPISDLGTLPESATPLQAPHVEAAGDGYRLRTPYWVRVTRNGNRCTGAISPDGREWTQVGSSTTVELGGTAFVGLLLTSCLGVNDDYAETGTGAFDNVSVTARNSPGWSVQRPATVTADLIAATGPDAIELAWTDPDPSARYTVLRADHANGRYETIGTDISAIGFGTRLRYTDATGRPATTYRYVVEKTNCAGSGPRSTSAAATMPVPAPPAFTSPPTAFANTGDRFQRLLRASHEPVEFTADGLPAGLRLNQRTGLISGTPARTGIYTVTTTARNATGAASGALTLNIGTPPPAPWTYGDLGDTILDDRAFGTLGAAAIRTPGITSYASETFTVRGAGVDLNLNRQGMTAQFVRQLVTGDCTITARLDARTGATADQVGLLMTKSINPFDQAAGAIVTAGTTAELMLRPTVAGASTMSGAAPVQLPVLLRLTRTASTFVAAVSTDGGTTWTALAQDVIPAFGTAAYYVGLVVCSRAPATLCTTQFSQVTVTHTT